MVVVGTQRGAMRRCGLGGPQPVRLTDRMLQFIMPRLGKGRLRCRAFEIMGCCATLLNIHASTQIPQHTQTHTYAHTMDKANQPEIDSDLSEPRTPSQRYTATVLRRTRSE